MKFRAFTLNVTLAVADILGLQFAARAAADYSAIAANPVTNLEGQTFFSHPPRLVRAVTSEIGIDTPSTCEFTLTILVRQLLYLRNLSSRAARSPSPFPFIAIQVWVG